MSNKNKTNKKISHVDQVVQWRLCMGCGACKWACPNGAISLKNIINKGIKPIIDGNLCEKCGKCVDVCPGLSLEHKPFPDGVIEELKDGWGPILEIHEGYAADESIRFAGSSGGIATALALYAIEQAGFVGVLHIKVSPDNPIENIPTFSTTKEELLQTTGSRYAPAAPCQAFDLIKNANGKCMFISKPCDCAALRKACELDPDLATNVGLIVSIFCAGTPTTAGTLATLKTMGVDNLHDVKSFKYRGDGWPGMVKVVTHNKINNINVPENVYTIDDNTREMTYDDAWGNILSHNGQLRCRLCPDSTGEFADISSGDSWYRKNESNTGLSLILSRTNNGQLFIDRACKSNYISIAKSMPLNLPNSQKSVYERRCQLHGRLGTMLFFGVPTPKYINIELKRNWEKISFKNKFKTIYGTFRRIWQKNWRTPDID